MFKTGGGGRGGGGGLRGITENVGRQLNSCSSIKLYKNDKSKRHFQIFRP